MEELASGSGTAKPSNLASHKTRYVNKKLVDLKVNSSEEKSFPIPYHIFLEYTNVLELVDAQIKIARRHSYEQFINNMAYVHKLARRCYIHFYMQPKSRKRAPLKDLTVSEDCPKQLKMHLMDIPEKYQKKKSKKVETSKNPAIEVDDDLLNPKPSTSKSCNSKPVENSTECFNPENLTASSNCPPPSYKVFKKFVNFEDEITQRILSCAEDNSKINKSNLREKFELEFYREFYRSPTLRHKLNWKLRPCPRKIREQILTHLPLEDEVLLSETPTETDNIPAAEKNKNELKSVQQQQKKVSHFKYPISFELFKKYTYHNQIVDEIFRATADGNAKVFEEFKSNKALRESTFKNYYEAFYRTPHIREKFKIKMKPCPSKIKNLVLQVPTEAVIFKTNLMSSNKRTASSSKTLVSPQAKKQKTMETIDRPLNTPTTIHTNQQLIPNNGTQKNVQVKTISSTNWQLLRNYCDKKTVHFVEGKRQIIHKIIKDRFFNANAAGKSVANTEQALKEVGSPKSNSKSMLASKTHSLSQKKITTKKEMSQKIQERPLESLLSSEVNLASAHDSDETDVNSELERTTVRNVQIRPKDKKVPPRSCTANVKRKNDDTINKLENNAQKNTLVKEGGELPSQKGLNTATSHHTQKAKSVGENVTNERNGIEAKKKSVLPKATCAYLEKAYDSDDTDVNSELEMTTVRNVSVRPMEEQRTRQNCNANLNPNGPDNINEPKDNVQKNTVMKNGEVMSQKELKTATSHSTQEAEILGEKVVSKGNENEAKKKSVSPGYQASAQTSDEADINSKLKMTTVTNVPLHSKNNELPSKIFTDNLNPGNRSNINELETEVLVKERQVQSQEGTATLNATHHTQESRIVEDKNISIKNKVNAMKPMFHNGSKENKQLNRNKLNMNKNTQVELTSLVKTQPLSVAASAPTKESMAKNCINETFFRKVDKFPVKSLKLSLNIIKNLSILEKKHEIQMNYTLAFAVRRSRGLKQRILSAILKMSMKEFSQYTRIYERPKFYEDSEVLKKVYKFAITTEQIWPPNLYMTLSDILNYLMSKGIAMQNLDLQHISPKLLHFEELSIITNFDEIVHLDYFKEKAKKLDESQIKERRHSYYNRCWAYNEWIWRDPTLYENWELIVKHKNTDIIARLITPPLDNICTYTEDLEITETLDMEMDSTSINRADDDIEPQDTATEHLIESSWGLVLTELEKRAQGLKSTEDDVETVIFPITQQESTSTSQKSYKSNDSSVEDMQDIQTKEIANNKEVNPIETSDENKASTSQKTAETVNQKSIILSSLNLQETTNKTLLPLSPNIFISSSGSTTSQPHIQHHLTQSCTSTLTFSNTSLTISSCTSTSTQVLDFFVNMPNTQNQIESLPIDEMLYNDSLNDETQHKESMETNLDHVLCSNDLLENDAESNHQVNKRADTLASFEKVPEEQQQSDTTASADKINAVLNKNTIENVPTKILESVPKARDASNRADNQSASKSKHSGDRNSIAPKQAASSQSLTQPNERGISEAATSKYKFKNTSTSESLLMDESGIVPLSVKQENINQRAQLGLKHIVRTEDYRNLSTIVIDDSDDESDSKQSVKNDFKVEPEFLSNLQFSLDDSNSSVHVHTLQETPAIIIDDDCDVNVTVSEAATNLINLLMNPTEQTTFPSLLLSGISSSFLNDAASTFSEAQRLPSSLEESGSIYQTPQTEPNQETNNSNDTLNNNSEDGELFLEINVQKVVDLDDQDNSVEYELCETKPAVTLKLKDDQKSDQIDNQTTTLPSEAKKSSTNMDVKKHKTAVATKLNRQIENKNSHLVPQITHAFRSLPVTVAKAKFNENPKMADINAAPSTSRNCSSVTEISNTQADTNNSKAEGTKTVESGSTTKSFSASQALATDCTLFDNSQLLRDLEKVKSNNIETSTVAFCAELKATSSTSSMSSTASARSSSQQVNEQNKHIHKTIIYRNLYQFHYFSALNEQHMANYELPHMAFEQQYMQAHVRVRSGHRLKIFGSDFKLLFPTFSHSNLCDLFYVLNDMKEYHFNLSDRHAICANVDLRERVLFYLFYSAPIFCYCNLKFDVNLREYATCVPITSIHNKSLTRQPRLPLTASIKLSILKNMSKLKLQLASQK